MKKLFGQLLFASVFATIAAVIIILLFFMPQDKDTFALIKCNEGETIKQTGDFKWQCTSFAGVNIAGGLTEKNGTISLVECPQGQILKSDGNGAYQCGVDEGGVGSGEGILAIGEGNGLVLEENILSLGTANLTDPGALSSQDYAIFYNKVSSVTAGDGLVNSGTARNPVIEIVAGNGLSVSSNTINAVAGDNSIIVNTNGIKSKLDLNGGLVVSVNGLSIRQDCASNEIVKWDGFSWDCAADNGTAYTAGTGIQIVSDTISNTGVISITPGTGLTNTGTAQNPILGANFGITAGTIAEGDKVVILNPSVSGRNNIVPTNGTTTPLSIEANAAQTADLLQIKATGGANLVNVTSDGRVGIGDDTPDSELDVEGTIRTNDIITKGPIVDVRAFDAVCDGITDDTAEITAAMNSLPSDGGVIFFPTGKCLTTGIIITKPNITFRGNGMWNTMIITNSVTNAIFEPQFSADVTNTIFEDMTINGNELAVVGIALHGNELIGGSKVSRVRFIGSDYGIRIYNANNVVVENSLFQDPGNGSNGGILIANGSRNVNIRENKFFYLLNAIITDTGTTFGDTNEEITEHVTIENNYFDMGYYTKLSAFTNSGGTVSYTDTTLTDTAANFTGISGSAVNDLVKVMPLREENTTGTGVTIYGNRLVDTNAQFVTTGVMQGDIVEVSTTHIGIVSSVQNETTLWVEEWLSQTDRSLLNPPASSSAYEVYGVFLALTHARTATQLTVNSWQAFNGDSVEPSGGNWIDQDSNVIAPLAGTKYEYILPNFYAINAESSARYFNITGNTVKRTYSDQISTFGYRNKITNNYVEYGNDMGITIYGDHNLVANNVVRQSGTSGIIIDDGSENTIQSNMIYGHTWRKVIFNDNTLGGISLLRSSRNYITNNFIDGLNYFPADKGIVIIGDGVSTPAEDNILKDNVMKNHSYGGIVINGAWATGTQLFGNTGEIASLNGGVIPDTSTIVSETDSNTTFALKLMTGQTGNLQEWRTATGSAMAQIAPDGSVQFNMQTSATGSFIVHGDATRALVVDYASNNVGINTAGTPTAALHIDNHNASQFALLVRDTADDARVGIDDNGGIQMLSKPATSGNPYRSSGTLWFQAQYWNGASVENETFQITNSRFASPGSDNNALTFFNLENGISPLVLGGGSGGQVSVGYDAAGDAFLTTLGQFHARSRATTTPTITAMGANGQTASLQKWLNHLGTTLAEIDAQGNLKVPHLVGNTTEPGIAANAGAGSGALVDVTGTDLSGEIVLVTGTGATGSSAQVTITFNSAYGTAPYVVISPANANAAALNGATAVYPTSTTTTLVINSGSTNLTDSTVYEWTYHVIQ